jgi:propanediol dehydratase small subunit
MNNRSSNSQNSKNSTVHTNSGRALDELTIDGLRAGTLTADDFRISRETLDQQAQAAEQAGYSQLAENLRRGAEMTGMSNQQVLDIYNLLRPGRAAYGELIDLAQRLEHDQAMPLVAAFVREAAEAYRERGLVKAE